MHPPYPECGFKQQNVMRSMRACCQTSLNVGGETRNNAFQFTAMLQNMLHVFVPHFTVSVEKDSSNAFLEWSSKERIPL